METANILFRQLFEKTSSTYTYLIADKKTNEAIIIDSVRETAERDINLVKELGLKLVYILETHVHADHVTGAHLLKKATGAKTMVSKNAKITCTDGEFGDDDYIKFGNLTLKCISTPGHTDTCTSFYIDGFVITGDALMIRACGRTDFQQGSPEALYDSVKNKLYKLPDSTLVYPAHNYNGLEVSSIGEEKKWNPRLGDNVSKEKFIEIMKNLKLSYPAQIDVALPANMKCGNPDA